jgi:hypothetical protein
MKMIFGIAIGYVAGQMLLELLGVAASWSGGALVRGFSSIARRIGLLQVKVETLAEGRET